VDWSFVGEFWGGEGGGCDESTTRELGQIPRVSSLHGRIILLGGGSLHESRVLVL